MRGESEERQDNPQNGKVDWLINGYRNKIKVIGENRDVFLWVNWTMIHWCEEIRIPGLAWQASTVLDMTCDALIIQTVHKIVGVIMEK